MPSFMDYIKVSNKIGIMINDLNNLVKFLKKDFISKIISKTFKSSFSIFYHMYYNLVF